MRPESPSILVHPLLLIVVALLRGGAAEDADCDGSFRAGKADFVPDVEDAVKEGAAMLSTERVLAAEPCEAACCADRRCNLALLEPSGGDGGSAQPQNRSCVLFNCIHRRRFVCRFVNKAGYQTYIRDDVYRKYLDVALGPDKLPQPIAIAGPDVVVQPGATVMLNGSESLSLGDASITGYSWSLLSGNTSVRMEKTDLEDQVQLSNLFPGPYVFQLTVTDSNGQSRPANVTVLVLGPELSSLYCLVPEKVGPCRAAFPRWRYDETTGECLQFTYGGCKQNHNNFLSKEDCLSACRGITGTSERSRTRSVGKECGVTCGIDQLTCDDDCCLDRSLECDNTTHCSDASDESHCMNQTLTRLLNIDVNQRKAQCTEPPRTGPCRASHTRWYYDPLETRCYSFTYGGCDGNNNNFENEDECSTTCEGVTERHVYAKGIFERFEEEDDDNSGAVALGVILTVVILALLAIVAYCFLKTRRKHLHQPVATAPPHVALSVQETPVYNSTTKPM